MKQCPLNGDYRFRSACRVTTCKMHTERTKNACLVLDTSFSPNDKAISDVELAYYKKPDKSAREMSSLRKRAVSRAQAVIVLRALVNHILANEKPHQGLNSAFMAQLPDTVQKSIQGAFASKVFRIKYLDMEAWMLAFILDKNYAEKVIPSFYTHSIHLLFRWSQYELETVVKSVTKERLPCPE